MCRGAFRSLTSGLGSPKPNGKQRQPARSSLPEAKDGHMKPDNSKTATFKPKIEQHSESSYRDRATERREDAASGLIKFEAIPEKFESQNSTEDKAMVEGLRKYLGGDAEHTCKERAFAPLEQTTDRLAFEVSRDDELKKVEGAFRKTSAVVCQSSPLPSEWGAKKRTREDIVEEVKNKRSKSESEGIDPKSELDPRVVEDKTMEEAKPAFKLEPVGGRKPIASASKKGKNDEKKVQKEAPKGPSTARDSGVDIIYIDYSTDGISDDDKGREDITHEGAYAAAGSAHLSFEVDRSEESSREDSVGLDGFITQHQDLVPMHPSGGTKVRAPKSGAASKTRPPTKNANQQVAAAFPAETVGSEGSNGRAEGRVTRSQGKSQNNGSSNMLPAASRVAGRRQKTTTPSQWLAARPCERCAHDRAACFIKKEDRTCCRCQRRKVGCTLASRGAAKGRKVKLEAEEARRKEEEERKKKEREEELEAIQIAIRENGVGPVGLTSAVTSSEFDLVAAIHEAERLCALMTTNFIGFMKDSLALRNILGKLLAYTRELDPASTQPIVEVLEGMGREESKDEDEEREGMVEELTADEE